MSTSTWADQLIVPPPGKEPSRTISNVYDGDSVPPGEFELVVPDFLAALAKARRVKRGMSAAGSSHPANDAQDLGRNATKDSWNRKRR
jgi:hypothetical protein